MREYVHRELNEIVTSIGGHYTFTKEERLPFNGREVLYLHGYAVFDTTCCGGGGCNYALVIGFIGQWKEGSNDEGLPVSMVEPIRDADVQKEVSRLIQERGVVTQVNFKAEC